MDRYESGTVTLTNSTISGNTAFGSLSPASGGGILNADGRVTLTNSTISGNTASSAGSGSYSYGGGIFNESGKTLTLTNSTISGNTASSSGSNALTGGGGIVSHGGTVATITFCTVYGNTAQVWGGIAILAPDRLTMRNSLVAANHAYVSPDVSEKLISGGYNLIQDTTGIIFLDPYHMHRTDVTGISPFDLHIAERVWQNGGPTPTLALLPDSPAIDVIPLEACRVEGVTTDQRGVRRPQGPACDIGAYEYEHRQ